jgi:NaMN:DMB phosphoribosyltransferase
VFSFVLLSAGMIGFAVIAKVTGTKPLLGGRIYGAAWLLVVGLELGRDMWAQRHRYASTRWLRAVDAAVGSDVTVHALADLARRREHDPVYVVTRPDLRSAVQA